MNKHFIATLGVCLASVAQVVSASPPTGGICGGIAGLKCVAPNEYCDYGAGKCKTPDAAGTCKVKPAVCTDQFLPVCGCDGKAYDNACRAAAAGVSVYRLGKCKDH